MVKICDNCKKEFSTNRKDRKYCSRDCYTLATSVKKIEVNCKVCNKSFLIYPKDIKRYCSSTCYHKDQEGSKRSEDFKKAQSERMKSYNMSYKGTKRAKNISKAVIQYLTEEEKSKVNNVLKNYPLLTSMKLLDELTGVKSRRCRRYLKEINRYPLSKTTLKSGSHYMEEKVQLWDLKKIRSFKEDYRSGMHYDGILKKYKIGDKVYYRLLKDLDVRRIYVLNKFRETAPEYYTRKILENNKIIYQREVSFNDEKNDSWYRVDFVVGNYAIEVQGDYWHGNPEVYNIEDISSLSNIQINNMKRDNLKKEYLKNQGYQVIEIWERDLVFDIRNNLKITERGLVKLLEDYIDEDVIYDNRLPKLKETKKKKYIKRKRLLTDLDI